MTTDEMLVIAQESGVIERDGLGYFLCAGAAHEVLNFAALVAAKAAEKEREACARKCESIWKHNLLTACAAAIRARGDT